MEPLPIVGRVSSISNTVDGIRVQGWISDEGKIFFENWPKVTEMTEQEWLLIWTSRILQEVATRNTQFGERLSLEIKEVQPRLRWYVDNVIMPELNKKGEQDATRTATPSMGRRTPPKKR